MNILITMTADNAEDLEWREREMRKLLISQDLNIVPCSFPGRTRLFVVAAADESGEAPI